MPVVDLNDDTRELGPRVLLHEGATWIGRKQFDAFLFNDFLLLCRGKSKVGSLQVYRVLPLKEAQLVPSESALTVTMGEDSPALSFGDGEELWRDELVKAHQRACAKQAFKPLIPALQRYIGSMQLTIITASCPRPSAEVTMVIAELGYQKVQTTAKKMLAWGEAFIISVTDLQDNLRLSLCLPGNPLTPPKVLGSAKLSLDILEYQQSLGMDLPLLAKDGSTKGQISIRIVYKTFS
jgi:hypothetical protein